MSAIALIGLSGSGKSTVGPLLAQRLGLPHHDVDRDLERQHGCTIREIFAAHGEPHFRALERDLTLGLLEGPGVLSLGGGAPMTPEVARALAGHPVVWLRVEPESAAERTPAPARSSRQPPGLSSAVTSTVSALKAIRVARRPATVSNRPVPSMSILMRRSLPAWAGIVVSP